MSVQPCIVKKIFEDTHLEYGRKVLNLVINSNKLVFIIYLIIYLHRLFRVSLLRTLQFSLPIITIFLKGFLSLIVFLQKYMHQYESKNSSLKGFFVHIFFQDYLLLLFISLKHDKVHLYSLQIDAISKDSAILVLSYTQIRLAQLYFFYSKRPSQEKIHNSQYSFGLILLYLLWQSQISQVFVSIFSKKYAHMDHKIALKQLFLAIFKKYSYSSRNQSSSFLFPASKRQCYEISKGKNLLSFHRALFQGTKYLLFAYITLPLMLTEPYKQDYQQNCKQFPHFRVIY